jgi:hypothetical protein
MSFVNEFCCFLEDHLLLKFVFVCALTTILVGLIFLNALFNAGMGV